MAGSGSALGAFAIGALFVVAVLPNQPDPSESARAVARHPERSAGPAPSSGSQAPVSQILVNRYGTVALARAPDGHFYADALVNGAEIRFLIDTGASSVVLTPTDAERAGISGKDYSVVGKGVGGDIPLMPATADCLELGSIAARDVPLMIAKANLPISLLGQSYLSQLGSISISGDTMTLR